jgi:hypothetical protein
MALMRAAGIPARLYAITARSEVLKDIWPDWVVAMFPREAGHIYCECCLSGRWIACETLFDAPLYEGLLAKNILSKDAVPTIDWDGETDFTLIDPWLIRDIGICASYEDVLSAFERVEGRGGFPPYHFLGRLGYALGGWIVNVLVNRHLDKIRVLR